jgi:hypothetical protein
MRAHALAKFVTGELGSRVQGVIVAAGGRNVPLNLLRP